MKNAILFSLLLCAVANTSFAQLQTSLTSNLLDSEIEICYHIRNLASDNITLNANMENKISVLYGNAPLQGFSTNATQCFDSNSWTLSSAHPSIDQTSLAADVILDKILGLEFEANANIILMATETIELFCINIGIDDLTLCEDLVYWTFCDNEVADTYFNNYEIFPNPTNCLEGEF